MDFNADVPSVDLVSLGGTLSLTPKNGPAGQAPLSGPKQIS